ncbi:hypothetical protein [Chelativorans xinjiangense]|uniref:hypothetical protein n=1 Tax=Chelativorans xinjiangense TaxID=2681485 RepID=UPI00135B18F6|nr:hypothetical protein [Chelativorans xinjiangense]
MRLVITALILLLAQGMALIACADRETYHRTTTAFGNMAMSYPVWGAIIVREDRIVAYFLNLEDGSERTLSLPGGDYTSLNEKPGTTGQFMLTAKKGNRYSTVHYDFAANSTRTEWTTSAKILDPFQLDGKDCALRPNAETQKGLYHWSVLCEDGAKSSGDPIVSTSDLIPAPDRIVVVDAGEGEDEFWTITIKDGKPEIGPRVTAPLPYDALPSGGFLHHGQAYVLVYPKPASLYRVTPDGAYLEEGPISASINAAEIYGPHVLHFQDDLFVTAERFKEKGQIEIVTWGRGGEILNKHTVDVMSK